MVDDQHRYDLILVLMAIEQHRNDLILVLVAIGQHRDDLILVLVAIGQHRDYVILVVLMEEFKDCNAVYHIMQASYSQTVSNCETK